MVKEFNIANGKGELVPSWKAFIKKVQEILDNASTIPD
jgi:hypothetical protein